MRPVLPVFSIAILLGLVPSIMAVPRVLVFTATAGYRHDSIPTAIRVLGEQSDVYNVSMDFTEDARRFTDEGLNGYDALMFVSATGDVLNQTQQTALRTYFQSGGNFVGVHATADCLGTTDWFVQQVGARFDYHPELQSATFLPLNKTHPSMTDIPDRWTFEEEVYYFRSDPRDNGAQVLMTVDESSYTNTGTSTGSYNQGDPHPIAWTQTSSPGSQPILSSAPGSGRSFFTSLGHLNETWEDPTFIGHVMKGLAWTLQSGSTKASNASALVGSLSTQAGETSSTTGASSTAITGSGSSATASTSTTGQPTQSSGSADKVSTGGILAGALIGAIGLVGAI